MFIVFFDVEIYRATALVGKTALEYLACVLYLLGNMPRRSRFDRWRQYVESLHSIVVSESKMLYHFHRLELLETCFFLYLVFAVVGIVFEMTHIGDIAYVSHFITAVFQPSEKYIECYGRACVS